MPSALTTLVKIIQSKTGGTLLRTTPRRHPLAGIGAITAAALVATTAPAIAADGPSSPSVEQAAVVVERATGTEDLAPSHERSDAAAQATIERDAESVTITAPAKATGGVEVGNNSGDRVSLTLAGAKAVSGVKAGSGTVVYPDAASSVDLAVQPTRDGSVRTLVTLKSSAASTKHRFELDLPDETWLRPKDDGGFDIIEAGEGGEESVAGSIAAPWAKDAQGRPVPTRYTADGHTLLQEIYTAPDTAFPVVADPKITFGWGVYINMWGHELGATALAVGFGAEVGLAYICGKARLVLGTACGLAIGGKVLFPTYEAVKKLKPKKCYQNKFGSKRKWKIVSDKNCKY
ncbi:hypothetical protein HCJ93_24290 [Streptomyces sp. SBST2-5]|uniref:Uncharacterized protein n=1 Tax=Streptomyces composti TaxID=2720025 RepID=A0ABX1AHM1_9ACTN|nr:hypothetical protein [Streptomyces composti]NJP53101.1 hypothetical protein [Streptomyces composti]